MSTGKGKTALLTEDSSEMMKKRIELINSFPFPISLLYKDLIIRAKLGEDISFFDVSRFPAIILKYLSFVTISDYLKYSNEKKCSSREINRMILDYFDSPDEKRAHGIINSILSEFVDRELSPSAEGLMKLLSVCPDSKFLPDFVDRKASLIDVFMYFFRIEEELNQGSYLLKEPSGRTIQSYFALIEYIVIQLAPILSHPICVLDGKSPGSCSVARGTDIKSGNMDIPEKYLHKAVLKVGGDSFVELHPFVSLKVSSGGSPETLLFLHRASVNGCSYMDYLSSREIRIEEPGDGLAPDVIEILNRLRGDAPPKKVEPLSPIVNFDSFINSHAEHFVGREVLHKEIEGFIVGNNRKYAILTGETGRGKTALLCKLVNDKKKNPCIYHFVKNVGGLDRPGVILRSLIGQLMVISGEFNLHWRDIPRDLPTLINMFNEELATVAARCKRNEEKLIFVFDGLDDSQEPGEILDILPSSLPDNVVGIISVGISEDDGNLNVELPFGEGIIYRFKNCPLKSFTLEESGKFLKKAGLSFEKEKRPQDIINRIHWSSLAGEPLILKMLTDGIICNQFTPRGILCFEEKPPEMDISRWREYLLQDEYYRISVLMPLYTPVETPGITEGTFPYDLLGVLLMINHPVNDDNLASIFKTDIYRIMKNRRSLNKFLIFEDNLYSPCNNLLRQVFSNTFTHKDLIKFHEKIIDFYEIRKPHRDQYILDSKELGLNALKYLPHHYYMLGNLTGDYSRLFEALGNDRFRMEQGLRLGVPSILESLKLAIDAAIKSDDISALVKYGFLFDDIQSGGIKGGLSMIVTQSTEGNFTEALDIVRKIQDRPFKYKQMLFITWLIARSDDFLKTMEILDEALVIPGATFSEEDEDLIFKITETLIEMGIAEGLDILKTGVGEERVVRYYSRLAGILAGYPDLILKIATGISMQLRKISDESLKSKFIVEFGRIIIGLDDEIKKRQFFENLIYEARNLDDEKIKYTTLAELAQVFKEVDLVRCEDILRRDILGELEEMGDYSVLRFSLEANMAGRIATIGNQDWAIELFEDVIERASKLMIPDEKADILQEIARSLIFLEDPDRRADLLEKIFGLAETLEDTAQQTKVMIGISEVLTDSDEDAKILHIYSTTFTEYIDELPVDSASKAIQQIAPNMKILREEDEYENVMTVVSNLILDLKSPAEKAATLKAVGEGLCKSHNLPDEVYLEYLQGFIDLTSEISGFDSEKSLADVLAGTANCLAEDKVYGREILLSAIIAKVAELEDENAKSGVYAAIGGKINNLEADEVYKIYDHLEIVIRDCRSSKAQSTALMGVVRGVTRIEDRIQRERLIGKLIYIAENLEEKKQAYRVMSALMGGVLNAGEEEWGIELYKKALSLIPLKEEKAPEALGGIMAGLCRGISQFAREDWAVEIYEKLLNRLDFIAPEKKKLEVFLGITDSLKALEDRETLKEYYSRLIILVENFMSRRSKTLGFLRLARSFFEINEKKLSRNMWERCITVATSLDDEADGKTKADVLSQAIISIWDLKASKWMTQASNLILDGASGMSPKVLNEFIKGTFSRLQEIKFADPQNLIIERIGQVIENIGDDEDRIKSIKAISEGIKDLPGGRVLRQILDRVVKIIKKIKQGRYRVRAMAIISSNFFNIGAEKWGQDAYKQIDKAYGKLKDRKVKSILLGEMLKIPFSSKDTAWQDNMSERVFNRELKDYTGRDKCLVLSSMAGVLPRCGRKEWVKSQINRILAESSQLDKDSQGEIYRSLFGGFAESGDIESIMEYQDRIKHRRIKEISSEFLRDTLLHSVKIDLKKSFQYYGTIEDQSLKLELLREFFERLMSNRSEFEKDEFSQYYRSLLKISVLTRDSLDFVIGNVISYYEDGDRLIDVAFSLGLLEKKREVIPEAEILPVMEEAVPEAVREVEIEEPIDLLSSTEKQEAVVEIAPEREVAPKRKGLLHRKTPVSKKPLPKLSDLSDTTNLSDFLKDGYQLVEAQYFGEAIRYFQKAAAIYENDPRGFIGLAATFYMMRDYRQAARYYASARDVNLEIDNMERFLKGVPKNTYLWYDFAKNLFEIGEFEEAIKFCDKVKSEGVYFDFVQKVDGLREKCVEAKTVVIKVPKGIKRNTKSIIIAASILVLIIFFRSGLSWFNYMSGLYFMNQAYHRVNNGYATGITYGKKSEYRAYSYYFKKAINQFNKSGKALAFPEGMFDQSRFNSARCKYEVSHFVRLRKQWDIPGELTPTELEEVLKYRKQAIGDLDRLKKKRGVDYKAMYYMGLCDLDFALDPLDIRNQFGADRKNSFYRAIDNFKESISYSSGNANIENYLMLAIARVEAYIAYRGMASGTLLEDAISELKKTESMGNDPRVFTYEIAAFRLRGNKSGAEDAYKRAVAEIESQYAVESRKKDYWLEKAKKFSEL
ncbi:MAG: ATP-binding protein [Candidatus Eremiobacteraeota bacterium]|nr:ATP-binding protein [Candidatus Eremiobacteraeota bacterium]